MRKKSSIIKLSIIGVVTLIALVLCFTPMNFGLYRFKSFAGGIKLGLDLKGGVYAVYEGSLKEDSTDDFNTAMESTITALQSTLTSKGYTEATIQREGSSNIRVSVPDIEDPQEVLNIIGSPAEIRFELRESDGTTVKETVLTGNEIDSARATTQNGDYVVALSLNKTGASKFYNATSSNVGSKIYIVSIVNGERKDISSPTVNSAISGGQAVISGMGSASAAETLAGQIQAGKLSLTLTQKDFSTISATLGEGALTLGVLAGAIGLILIIALIIFLYGLFGVAGSLAMLIYAAMMIVMLAIFPWVQLTLPGIAGILLSIGMAIDGNVIIYERIKDEYRKGKSILSASYYGFRKSISSILDGNITTIIAAVVLWIFGTGSVRGFAVTLIIGLILSVFSSLVVTRGLVKYMININQTNPKLYKLTRGEGFENLSAEQNSPAVDLAIAEEQRKKLNKSKPVLNDK